MVAIKETNKKLTLKGGYFILHYVRYLTVEFSQGVNVNTAIDYLSQYSFRWKLHGEIQRHTIVTMYMFMTNDQCEDSFM